MRRVFIPVAALAVALGLIAVGCGGSASAIPELTSFTQVASTSASADTARFTLAVDVGLPVPGDDASLSFTAEGGFDTPAKR